MHAGFLNVDAEKMSKSLGNFVTIQQVLDAQRRRGAPLLPARRALPRAGQLRRREVCRACGERFAATLKACPKDGATDPRIVFPSVDEAERRVEYLYATREALVASAGEGDLTRLPKALAVHRETLEGAREKILAALDKDLNTPVALAHLGELAKASNEILRRRSPS